MKPAGSDEFKAHLACNRTGNVQTVIALTATSFSVWPCSHTLQIQPPDFDKGLSSLTPVDLSRIVAGWKRLLRPETCSLWPAVAALRSGQARAATWHTLILKLCDGLPDVETCARVCMEYLKHSILPWTFSCLVQLLGSHKISCFSMIMRFLQ